MNVKHIFLIIIILITLYLVNATNIPNLINNISSETDNLTAIVVENGIVNTNGLELTKISPGFPIKSETLLGAFLIGLPVELLNNETEEIPSVEELLIIEKPIIEEPMINISLPIENETVELPIEESSLITTTLTLIIDKVSTFVGDIINIQTILTYENQTPLPDKTVNFYSDELIGSDITDSEGKAEIKWDTSSWLPNVYTITANYSGSGSLTSSSVKTEILIEKVLVVNDTIEINKSQDIKREIIDLPTVILRDKLGNIISQYTLKNRTGGRYDLNMTQGLITNLRIKGLTSSNITAKVDLVSNPRVRTEVIAIDTEEFEDANITLFKYGKVDYILYCPYFDMDSFTCDQWQKTTILFTQTENSITFPVTHFTAYAGGGENDSSNLMVWDETDPEGGSNIRYISDTIRFSANYTNITSGEPINGAGIYCNIKFNITGSWTSPVNMAFNSTSSLYEHNRTFNQNGTFGWNTLCDGSLLGYMILNTTDSVTISTTTPSPNPTVTSVTVYPVYIDPAEQTDLSAVVRQSNYSISEVKSEIDYPNRTMVNYSMNLHSDFLTGTGTGGEPYNLTAPSFNLSIDCYDFSDGSECNVNASNYYNSCVNITFDDNETIGGIDEDLDIGVLLCITESDTNYILNFSRWDYDTVNEVGVKYCIDSSYGVNECSDWVLNSTATGYEKINNKSIYGGIYRKIFYDTFAGGRYDVKIYASDSFGRVNNSKTTYFYVNESDPPIIYLVSPANGTSDNDGRVVFEYNVTDDSGIDNCSLILNDMVNETDFGVRIGVINRVAVFGLNDGNYEWSINCTDVSVNANIGSSEEIRAFSTTDRSPPMIYLSYPINYTPDRDGDIIFKYYVQDYGYDINNCSLFINGTLNQINTTIEEYRKQTFSLQNLVNGGYNWSIGCYDTSPNSNSNSSVDTFIVDIETVPPIISLVSLINNSVETDGNIIFTYDVSDANSTISECYFFFDGTLNQTNYSVSESYSQTFSLNGINEGNHNWYVNCKDGTLYQTQGYSQQWTFTINTDNSAPTISLLYPGEGSFITDNNTITFYYNVTDNFNISNCSLIIDNVLNQTSNNITLGTSISFLRTLVNGNHNWSINCTDSSDNSNVGVSVTRSLTLNTLPNVSLNDPANGSFDSDGDVTFNFTVNDNIGLINCSLFTDSDGSWEVNTTNTFVQPNVSLYFEVEGIPDDTFFKWNVFCIDNEFNEKWGEANFTLAIDNTPPSLSNIPYQEWGEDNYTIINLSTYFSDDDGDSLTYDSTVPDNITVTIDNDTGLVTLEVPKNWFGNSSIIFISYDGIENTTSNNVILIITELGDTAPKLRLQSPVDNFNDTDGYLFFTCNFSDDYALTNISLYHNISGTWELSQTKIVSSGNYSISDYSATFNVTGLTDGSYLWNCLAYDNSSQLVWGENRSVEVGIFVNLIHEIPTWMVNDVNTVRYIAISYSEYLNNSLTLGDLTIYEADGGLYFTKNMSNSSSFNANSLMYHSLLINITPNEIFDNNFTVGNTAGLNLSIKYYYQGSEYEIKDNVTIEVVNETQW